MSIQNLDSLKALVTLMDLIKNPDKYQSIINQAIKVTAEYEKAVGHLKTVQDIQEYKIAIDTDNTRREVAVKEAALTVEKMRKEADQVQINSAKDRMRVEAEMVVREKAVKDREDKVLGLEASQAQLLKERELLYLYKAELEERQAKLVALEKTIKSGLS